MVDHDDTHSSSPPTSQLPASVQLLNLNNVDNSLAAAQQSDVAARAVLLPALGINTGPNMRPDPSNP